MYLFVKSYLGRSHLWKGNEYMEILHSYKNEDELVFDMDEFND